MCKVSIIMPVHNKEDYLYRSLNSLVKQSLNDIEIICIDDSSTDTSCDIIENFSLKDKRIKLIRLKKNLGTSDARKKGIQKAIGQYIMFLDPDDEFKYNACEALYNDIVQNEVDILQFGVDVINDGGFSHSEMNNVYNTMNIKYRSLTELDILRDFKNDPWRSLVVWNKIYQADFLKRAVKKVEDGYYVISEDMYFILVVIHRAKSYRTTLKKYISYHRGCGSVHNRIYSEKEFLIQCNRADCCRAARRYVDYVTEKSTNESEIWLLNSLYEIYWYQRIAYSFSHLITRVDDDDNERFFQLFLEHWGYENVLKYLKKKDYRVKKEIYRLRQLSRQGSIKKKSLIIRMITFFPRGILKVLRSLKNEGLKSTSRKVKNRLFH